MLARSRSLLKVRYHYNILEIEDAIPSYSFSTTSAMSPRWVTGPYSEHFKLTLTE